MITPSQHTQNSVFHILTKHSGKLLPKWLCYERQDRNKYLTFVETQSFCSDHNKTYTFQTQQNTVTAGVRKRNRKCLLHDTVVDCGRLHVKLAVGFRYKHKHTGEPHSHEFVHFMSLWSNRLKTYDGVKKFVFKEKAPCPLRVPRLLSLTRLYLFLSSTPIFIWTSAALVCVHGSVYYICTHCLGNWILPYCEGEAFYGWVILRRAV